MVCMDHRPSPSRKTVIRTQVQVFHLPTFRARFRIRTFGGDAVLVHRKTAVDHTVDDDQNTPSLLWAERAIAHAQGIGGKAQGSDLKVLQWRGEIRVPLIAPEERNGAKPSLTQLALRYWQCCRSSAWRSQYHGETSWTTNSAASCVTASADDQVTYTLLCERRQP